MENTKMTNNISIDLSGLDEDEIVYLLLKVVKVAQRKNTMLQTEKGNLEKDIETIQQNAKRTLAQKEEEWKKELNTAEKKAQMALEGKEKQHRDELDAEKEKASQELVRQNEEWGKELETIKKEFFLLPLQEIISQVKVACEQCKDKNWKKFLSGILVNAQENKMEEGTFDNYVFKMRAPGSWLAQLVSLEWWSEQNNLFPKIKEEVNNIEIIFFLMESFLAFLGKNHYKVKRPQGAFASKIEGYEENRYEDSQIIKLFPDFCAPKFVLCEVYSLSINDKTGKCIGIKK